MSGVGSHLVFFAIQASIFGVVCLGLNLQWGYTGLFNIGVAGFFLAGAYAFAILSGPSYGTHLGGFGWPYGLGLLGALAASALIAFIVGIPTQRLREDYLAIVTIGIASVLQLVALNAASLGKNPFAYRLQSFVIGSALMGLGGALYASFIGYISPEDFLPILTFQIWAMLIVGGSGNNKGALIGALVMWAVWTISGSVAQQLLPPGCRPKAAQPRSS